MRCGMIVVFWTMLLAWSWQVLGQKPVGSQPVTNKPRVSTSELQKWIEQLANADYQVRQEAIRKLREAGVDAIPVLEQALSKYDDPNIQRHIKEILRSYESVPQLVPTRVHLKLREVTLHETLQALSKATGYRFECTPAGENADGRIVYNWDWQNVTFWQALQDLCDRAGMSYVEGWYSHDGKTIRLEQGEPHPTYVSHHGPFRVSITGFSYHRNVSFLRGPKRWNPGPTIQRHESLQVNLSVHIEPRYAFIGLQGVSVDEAVDDKGVSRVLLRQNEHERLAHFYYGGGRMFQQQVSVPLFASDLGTKLTRFRGTIGALVIASERPVITIENAYASKGKRFEKGDHALQIDEIRDDGQMVQVKLQIWRGPQGLARDLNGLHTAPQRIKAFDAKGNELRYNGPMSWSNEQDSAHGTLMFQREQPVAAGPGVGIGRILGGKPKPEEELRIVYYEWDVISAQVPFDFRDVPLP
ncbi:MAG: HEAT repeat domain-containing protein [Gemmatales bacterium]|nr:HEAT repeat domain-containing protein [Gemmatales bacterium]MDW7995755.1 HEAT repeat domain-containing protein [Gemmatales bacterium]